MESRFPAWISQFLLRGGGARNGLLQQEDMQVQLRELEGRILAHVAEMRGESAREAAASLGLTLQREGVIGVTEEVRTVGPREQPPPSPPRPAPSSLGVLDPRSRTLPASRYVPRPRAGGSGACFGAGGGGGGCI